MVLNKYFIIPVKFLTPLLLRSSTFALQTSEGYGCVQKTKLFLEHLYFQMSTVPAGADVHQPQCLEPQTDIEDA